MNKPLLAIFLIALSICATSYSARTEIELCKAPIYKYNVKVSFCDKRNDRILTVKDRDNTQLTYKVDYYQGQREWNGLFNICHIELLQKKHVADTLIPTSSTDFYWYESYYYQLKHNSKKLKHFEPIEEVK